MALSNHTWIMLMLSGEIGQVLRHRWWNNCSLFTVFESLCKEDCQSKSDISWGPDIAEVGAIAWETYRSSTLDDKLDLHKFTRWKYGAKKVQTRGKSKAKMVNTVFACQFTWEYKLKGKCGIYHLCPLFNLSLHLFASNLHWLNLV